MKQLLILSAFIFVNLISYGQNDSSILFELSKGKWLLPIKKVMAVENNERRKSYTADMFDPLLRIQTDSSYEVYCLHDAQIIKISEVDNEQFIITKYGNYFITYYCLTQPKIIEGDWIKTGQVIGNLTKGWSDKYYTLVISLYKNEKELNAKNWIAW